MNEQIVNRTRLVGAVQTKSGDFYNLWQKIEDGIIYWGVSKNESDINCAYRDLGYLAKIKGFSM